jgi:hypothetical protein
LRQVEPGFALLLLLEFTGQQQVLALTALLTILQARPVGNCGRYYAGDRIAVYGENCPELVASIAAGLGLDAHSLDDMFIMQKIQVSCSGWP